MMPVGDTTRGGITVSGTIRRSSLLKDAADYFDQHWKQDCIREAYLAGVAYLRNETGYHTPVREGPVGGSLIGTAGGGYNQHAAWFVIAGRLADAGDNGKQKPYGFAQENGWHDRAGGYHEGHHMVEEAAREGARTFREWAGRHAITSIGPRVESNFNVQGSEEMFDFEMADE